VPALTTQFMGLNESVGWPTRIGLVADPHGPLTARSLDAVLFELLQPGVQRNPSKATAQA
jgi:hypothetical protein